MKNFITYIKENNSLDNALTWADSLQITKGDYIICVDNSESDKCLTIGKLYKVVKNEIMDRDFIKIEDNRGKSGGWFRDRFRIPTTEEIKDKLEEIEIFKQKREEERLKHIDVDPYSEEDWN